MSERFTDEDRHMGSSHRGLVHQKKEEDTPKPVIPYPFDSDIKNVAPEIVKKQLGSKRRLVVASEYHKDKQGLYSGYNTYSVYDEKDSLVFVHSEKTLDKVDKGGTKQKNAKTLQEQRCTDGNGITSQKPKQKPASSTEPQIVTDDPVRFHRKRQQVLSMEPKDYEIYTMRKEEEAHYIEYLVEIERAKPNLTDKQKESAAKEKTEKYFQQEEYGVTKEEEYKYNAEKSYEAYKEQDQPMSYRLLQDVTEDENLYYPAGESSVYDALRELTKKHGVKIYTWDRYKIGYYDKANVIVIPEITYRKIDRYGKILRSYLVQEMMHALQAFEQFGDLEKK